MIIRINLVLNLLVFRQSLKAIIYRQFHPLTMPPWKRATRCRILLFTVTFRLSLQNILKEIIKSRYTLLAKTLSHKHFTDNSVFCAKNSSEVTFDNGGNHISTIIK